MNTKFVVVAVVLIIVAGCAGTTPADSTAEPTDTDKPSTPMTDTERTTEPSDDTEQRSEVVVVGTMLNSPTPLEAPASVVPEYGSEGIWNYSAVIQVQEVKQGDESITDSIILVHYAYFPPGAVTDENVTFPDRGSDVEISGVYDPERALLDASKTKGTQSPRVSVLGQTPDPPNPPVVAEAGEEFRIGIYTFSEGTVSTLSTGNTTIEIVNDTNAVVKDGRVRLGDTFTSANRSVLVEVRMEA